MADGEVFIHPAVQRMALRRQMAAAVERLLAVVEVLVRELDDGTPDPDLEPSLGAPEHPSHLSASGGWALPDGVFDWAKGASDDREADGDRLNARDADLEPRLGSALAINQLRWSIGENEDREREHDGREPTLGAPEPTTAANLDQRRWAQGGDGGERELVSEDEGAPTGDDEPEDHDRVPTYASDHDQQRIVGEPFIVSSTP